MSQPQLKNALLAQYERASFLALLIVLVLPLTSCEDAFTGPEGADPDLTWTGRFITTQNLVWASRRNLTSSEFGDAFNAYRDRGWIIVSTGAKSHGSGARYSMVWRENVDDRQWDQYRNMTSSEYHDRWTEQRDMGRRPLDVEGYLLGGQLHFSGIWIENVEDIEWWSQRNMTGSEYGDHFEEQSNAGLRPIDIEIYPTTSGPRIAAIWYENVDDLQWIQLRNMTRTEYQAEADAQTANGYRMIDYESYRVDGVQRYAAIWEKPLDGYGQEVRTNRTSLGFANQWRRNLDEGQRLVDLEHYETNSGDRYGGIWIENADRYSYEHRNAIDAAVRSHRETALGNDTIQGISVAVIHNGNMVYRGGFGYADVDAGKVAHGETIYLAASVSKVIGGTLAARLEAEGELQDGTSVNLDLSNTTSTYLTNIPSHHTHTVEQLTAHLGCVPHYPCSTNPGNSYCTWPGINRSQHFATAQAAAQSIWNTVLIDSIWNGNSAVAGCTIGEDRRYSSAAFTLVGAVLEAATGKPIDTLIEEELAEPFGLSSMRVQYAQSTLSPNYERARPYRNTEANYSDNSWKVLGGGIEVSAVDLARFGWKILDGEIIDANARDDRMWVTVDPSCTAPAAGTTCQNGIAWNLGTDDNGDRVAGHGGSWTGAGAHIRLYQGPGLAIAVMSNRRGGSHNPGALVTAIKDIIAP